MYLPLIDLLRFIASLGVMLFHYFSKNIDPLSVNPLLYFIKHGNLGVQLFFIISGIVIHFSIEKGFKNYVVSRFTRIFPIFWIICTATYLITIIFPPHIHQTFINYLINMTILAKNGTFATFVDPSYWTLRYELFFYILVGIAMLNIKKDQINKFYIGLTLSSLIIIMLDKQNGILGKILISKFALFFTFGGYLSYILINKFKNNKIKLYEWLFLILIPILFVLENYIMNKNKEAVALNNVDLYTTMTFFIVVPLAAILSLKIKNEKTLNTCKSLGAITYPLYLIHQKIGQIIIGDKAFGSFTLLSFFVLIIMILIAYYISKKEVILRKIITIKIKGILSQTKKQNILP